MIFLPLTYLCLPFTEDTYGTGSEGLHAFCWIKDVKDDCKTPQPYSEVAYAEVILIAIACIGHILFTIGIAVVFFRLAHTYRGMKHKHLKNIRDVFLLMCFLLTSVAFESPPGVVFLLVKNDNEIPLWLFILVAIGPPISMLIYPAGFFFYLYSFKKLKWESIKRAAAEWKTSCGCKQKQKRVHFARRFVTQALISYPSSHPPDVPSSTFFTVPFTGEFSNTDVTARENEPLISHIDTGYSK